MNRVMLMAWAGLLPWGGLAQSNQMASSRLPSGPLLTEPAPEYSAWSIAFEYPKAESEADSRAGYQAAWERLANGDPALAKFLAKHPTHMKGKPRIQEVTTVKTGDIRREVTTYTSGQKDERWVKGDIVVRRSGLTGKIEVETESTAVDFPELSWIQPRDFKEVRKMHGAECLFFEGQIERLQVEDGRLYGAIGGTGTEERLKATAVIDLKTRRPLSLEFERVKRTYTFGPRPSSKLVLPRDLAAAVQKIQQQANARNASLSSP